MAVLGALDDKIALNERIAAECFDLAQCLWSVAAGESSDYVTVGEVVDADKGLSYKGAGLGAGVPLINLGNFPTNGRLKEQGLKFYSGETKDRHWVSSGDLLVANTDLTQRREILGQPVLVPASIDKAIFTHHVFALRPRERAARPDLMWLYGALRDPAFRDRAVTFATGTTVLALPKDALLTYEVPWPDQDTRHGWANEAQALLSVADAYATENRMLATLRDTLLPGLMSGEIRVRDIDKNAGETS